MKKTIIIMFLVCIGLLSISLVNQPIANAVSYYNWVRNPSFEGNINLIEDAGAESGVFNSGIEYGNWSGDATFITSNSHSGVYSFREHYTGNQNLWYNFTESVLGADIIEFTFWVYPYNQYYNETVYIYYSDESSDNYEYELGSTATWSQINALDLINDAKYIIAIQFYLGDSTNVDLDDFRLIKEDIEGQTEVGITTSPWAIYDFGEFFSSFFYFDWELGSDITTEQYYDGEQSFEFIEGEIAPLVQSIAYLDSDLVHYADMYVKTNNTDGVIIAFGVNYADGRGSGKNITVSYGGGAWQHITFSNFIYDDAYITGIVIYCFDESGNGDSTYIDNVGLWASVNTDWKRFDFTLSPIPQSIGKSGFTVYQRVSYTLTFNLYDENGSKTESGNYQVVDNSFGLYTGTITNGVFSITLNQRASSTANTLYDTVNILAILVDETIELDLDATWLYVAVPSEGGEANAVNLTNWISLFCVVFLPAIMFSGGIYENNKQEDSFYIPPVFGLIAGLILSVGIGFYTNIVPLWILILMIIATVILIVGMFKGGKD